MLSTIKDILSSLKKTSTERISNPFYGVFVLTWIPFNWEALSILIFSDIKMDERVRFINSAYPFCFFMPFLLALLLTLIIPFCTEKLTYWQSRPISRTSTIIAMRKKKIFTSDISVERFRAKKDVAYDRYKVGAEKEIQDMKQEISESSIKTGELNNSLLEAQETIKNLKNDLKMANDTLEASPSSEVKLKELQDAISELKYDNYMKDKKLTANGALMASWRAQVLNLGGNPDEETPNSKN